MSKRKSFKKPTTVKLPKPGDGPRFLTLDIELIGIRADSLWGTFDQNIGISEIAEDWAIISAAAKWLHSPEMLYLDQRAVQDIRDDRLLVAWLAALIDKADIVCGHNIQKFDMRKLRARCVTLGITPFREPKIVDTMLMARRTGAFTSNKLEYLSAKLTDTPKLNHSNYPGKELWLALLRNDPAAWEECERYNIRDVEATENLYKALRSWAPQHPNLAHYYSDDETRCPRCGSKDILRMGSTFTAVNEYPRFLCQSCNGFSRGRFTMTSKEKRKALLTT